MTPLCYLKIGCGRCSVELNPWHVAQRIDKARNAGDPIPSGLNQTRLPGLCVSYRPDPTTTTEPGWVDPELPQISKRAFGFLVHSIKVESPRELTAQRTQKLRSKGCVLTNGRRLVTVKVEAVGVGRQATQYLGRWLTKRLTTGSSCCPSVAEIWEHCCDLDGDTGRRILTDVAEINAENVDGDTATKCGQLLEVTFTAADLLVFPDTKKTAVASSLGVACMPACPPTTRLVDREVPIPKKTYLIDLIKEPGGALRACPVDFKTSDYDPATSFLKVRNVSAEEPDESKCCPPQFDLDLTVQPPTVTPLQPDLWQTVLDQLAAGGLDCSCPPKLRRVRFPNKRYDPSCGNCPEGLRGRACAMEAGLTVGADGRIDKIASGLAESSGAGIAFWLTPGTPVPEAVQRLFAYLECLGTRVSTKAVGEVNAWDWQAIMAGDSNATGVTVNWTYGSTLMHISPALAAGSVGSDDVTARLAPPGHPAGEKLLTAEQFANCAPGVSPQCLPWVDLIEPEGSGPCVEVSLAADGSVAVNIDPAVNDLTDATFKVGPCSAVTAQGCPPIIPPEPRVKVDLTAGTAEATNFVPGAGWPLETEGSIYTISHVDGARNSSTPATRVEKVRTPITGGDNCPAPCGSTVLRRVPRAVKSCGGCLDPDQQILVAEISGLNPAEIYRPEWSITAVREITRMGIYVAFGPEGWQPPGLRHLKPFVCGDTPIPAVQSLKLPAGETLALSDDDLTITCLRRARPASGWIEVPRRAVHRPRISGAGKAWLIISLPVNARIPVTSFSVEMVTSV